MRPTRIKLCKIPKILIVEDDSSQMQLMVKLIREALDCEIVEAPDGLEALKIMLQDKQVPNLVLLDLILPFLSGIEFLKIIRGRAEFDHIKWYRMGSPRCPRCWHTPPYYIFMFTSMRVQLYYNPTNMMQIIVYYYVELIVSNTYVPCVLFRHDPGLWSPVLFQLGQLGEGRSFVVRI